VITGIDKGGNMAALALAENLGGAMFLGFLAAVAFATILAVVAGLTLAGASALSHDLYVGVIRHGVSSEKEEMKVAKAATIGLGITAVALALAFKGQNVAFMVGLAFVVAASANFPALIMSIMWKRFTTAGAQASIYTGLILAVVLIAFSPTVYEEVFQGTAFKAVGAAKAKVDGIEKIAKDPAKALEGLTGKVAKLQAKIANPALPAEKLAAAKKDLAAAEGDIKMIQDNAVTTALEAAKAKKAEADANLKKAPYKMKNPGVYSMGGAFLMGILVSLFKREEEAEAKFEAEKVRTYIGIGAEGASSH
jgi:cation/acetate symporter